ncbi:ArsC family reductase [Brevundimonas sp.]|uniref:ArsC family reductase n=1 Tax=Brevundimonas sp. TaxID=1871086 RepID=UPI00289EBF9F|nr:ArsC family reductase [Brevundimonas sp.]
MSISIYGIKACDTMKKARVWLDDNGVAYDFNDYKVKGAPKAELEKWVAEHGWEKVLNRAGTTFRKLPDEAKADLDAEKAIALMIEQPSMIKRPVLDLGNGQTLLGFKPETYQAALKG